MPDTPADDGSERPTPGGRTVRCPACGREHVYEPLELPCSCGASLRLPLLRGGFPVQVRFRSWEDSWVRMRCPACGRSEQWPQPEFTCACGAMVRLPVDTAARPAPAGEGGRRPGSGPQVAGGEQADDPALRPADAAGRPSFVPSPVRTPEDAVVTATRYLEWLGFTGLERSEAPAPDAVRLLGSGLAAQVDARTDPVDAGCVERLWLSTLHEDDAVAALFSLAGYTREARARAEQLLVALFALDLAGMPLPVNHAADLLLRTGRTS